jgi:hypothetical protein
VKLEELKKEEEEYQKEKRKQNVQRRKLDEIRDYQRKKRETEQILMMDTKPHKKKKISICEISNVTILDNEQEFGYKNNPEKIRIIYNTAQDGERLTKISNSDSANFNL